MMRTMMGRLRTLLALAAVALLAVAPSAGSATACRDFYASVNLAWQDQHRPAAGAFSVDRFDLAASAYEERIHGVLESAAERPGPANSVRRAVGDLYASCMDEAAIDRTAAAALREELRRVEDVVDPATLSEELAHLHDRGIDALFVLAPGVDPLGRVRFVAEIAPIDDPPAELALTGGGASRARAREAAYVGYGRTLFELAGDEPRNAIDEADAAFRLQDELLLDGILSRSAAAEPRDEHHPVHVGELSAVMAAIDWPSYLRQRGLSWMRTVNETAPGYIQRADGVLRTTPAPALRSYLRWRILSGYAPYLSRRFVEAGADFEAAVNGSEAKQLRWRRCTETTSALLPAGVAALGLENPVAARTDRRAAEVIAGIRSAMRGMIREASWLGPVTRRRIEAKLDALRVIRALPSSSIRFEPVVLDRSAYLVNVQRVLLLNARLRFRTLREGFAPPTLSASPLSEEIAYMPELNEVYLPPTVVQRPFVSPNRDPAPDYGGLGALVAHEFMHSLDEYGRKFDETGRVRAWWTAAEIAAYRKRVSCIARQFDEYRLPGGTRVDGDLVRDEALADLAGLEIAFRAYRAEQLRRDDSRGAVREADQRFFVSYARSHAETTRPDDDLTERLDEHAPEHLRVNGTLDDMPSFLRTFGCGPPPIARGVIARCGFW
jgi:putative endopeptidase